jgi:hypothetical protein
MDGALGAPTPTTGWPSSGRQAGHRLGGGDALDRTRWRAEERIGVQTEAAPGSWLLASPCGLRGFL